VSSGTLDSYTKALLHMDGADASTTFTDETGKTWSPVGTAQIDTAQKEFGSGSGLLDGNSDYITTPDNADFTFGSGNFTLDFWVMFGSVVQADQVFYSHGITAAPGYSDMIMQFNDSSSHKIRMLINLGTGWDLEFSGAKTDWATGTWYHIALVRNGSDFAVYVDGTKDGTGGTSAGTLRTPDTVVYVGCNRGGQFFNGWLDEYRISKGVARWTGNFTPLAEPYSNSLTVASEGTIKTQGSYSVKYVAAITESLNNTILRTFSPTLNLTNSKIIKFDIYASRTGANIKFGLHDTGGTTTEVTPTVASANTWQTVIWDISAVAAANKDLINTLTITIVNADAANTFYVDNMYAVGG
jgi:hypothetical protein